MKNKMYTLGRVGIRALGMLALCVGISSCTDDYKFDDEKPSWLGESVYARLQNDGNFTNYLRLMDELGMKEVLSRTGSRTVFAANDDAFAAFYEANAQLPELDPWRNATSYENLTAAQKALLAKSTMLNNSITMETLATQEGTLERGRYLRRPTLVRVSDNISFLPSQDLPYSYNLTGDVDYWAEFRNNPDNEEGQGMGIWLTDGDGTSNMMLCFTPEQRAKNNVTSSDFELVMNLAQKGEVLAPNDVYIYDAKITQQDITCQNGYINVLDKVVRPLPSMAEVIRTNGQTNIFSHILDRFSAPVYVHAYNEEYALVDEDFIKKNKIYTKWYFSGSGKTSMLGKAVKVITDQGVSKFEITTGVGVDDNFKVPSTYELKFDPAWNACNLVQNGNAETDMAAIFAPDDATLLESFKYGALSTLVEEFTLHNPDGLDPTVGAQLYAEYRNATIDNLEPLYRAIDQIPMGKLQPFVNNLMRETYNGSVESKFPSLKNDAQESLFGSGCTVKKVELACNGAVYITTSFHAPADYSSVAAPVKMTADKRVMEYAIYEGSNKTDANHMRGLYYFAYLKAMTSRFTLFLPDDEAMQYVPNPMSFASPAPRMIKLAYNKKFDKPTSASGEPIIDTTFRYNPATGEREGSYLRNASMTMADKAGVLTDILQTHTLVHDSEADVISQVRKHTPNVRNRYFITKSNAALKVTYAEDGSVAYVQGGFQIENEQAGLQESEDIRGIVRCNVKKSIEYQDGGNGDTYVIDAPVTPAVKSVWKVLEEHPQFERFLTLCMGPDAQGIDDYLIDACGFYNKPNGDRMTANEIKRLSESTYTIFKEKTSTIDNITSFFNQYQYTVFVPTEEAIERARAAGLLYDWADIEEDFYSPETTTLEEDAVPNLDGSYIATAYHFNTPEDSIRVRAKITHLFNFVRLHFMDNSVFADESAWSQNESMNHQNYATSCFYQNPENPAQGNFMKLHIKRLGNGQMTVQGMGIDEHGMLYPCGTEARVLDETGESTTGQPMSLCNIMAREIIAVGSDNQETDIHLTNLGANESPTKALNNKRVGSSSAAVIHLVSEALVYSDEPLNFEDPAKARAYLKYNKVVNKTEHK